MDYPQFDNEPIDNDPNGYGYNDYNGSCCKGKTS